MGYFTKILTFGFFTSEIVITQIVPTWFDCSADKQHCPHAHLHTHWIPKHGELPQGRYLTSWKICECVCVCVCVHVRACVTFQQRPKYLQL